MKLKLLTHQETEELEKWLAAKDGDIPSNIRNFCLRLLKQHRILIRLIESNKSLAERLKEAMGIKPKSERGSQINQRWGSGK